MRDGQRVLQGGFDFAAVLAQLGRDKGEPQRRVDRVLAVASHHDAIGQPRQAVLVETQPKGDGAVAQGDVVRLRPGEVLQRRAFLVGGHQPQVGLEAGVEQHARLGVAMAQDATHLRQRREGVHDGRGRADGEDVEVATRLGAAPEAADGHEVGGGIGKAQARR